jgi:chemotaxis protein CheX
MAMVCCEGGHVAMNVKFLNPFVEAAAEVLEKEVAVTVKRGNLTMQATAMTTDEVTVLINLVGQVQGVVLYCMPFATGLNMVSQMMGQKFTEFDTLAQSGVSELGNVITGRATIKLSRAGYQSNISPPTMIIGQGIQISTLDFSRIVVPIQTELGNMTVHLALRETPPGMHIGNNVELTIPKDAHKVEG